MDALKKKRNGIMVLVVISSIIFAFAAKNYHDQYKKEELNVIRKNAEMKLVFDLEVDENDNWSKGRNTDIVIEEFNKKGCKITFQEIQSAKVFYSDIKGNNKALESRKKIFEAIKKYKEVESLGDIGNGALQDYLVSKLDWQTK
ncbi:MAG: hypothetical protein HXL95_08325 [[Eubacterium] sulci]|nr:hypothetical protein [[Eubacterium] sulci]